jgi:oxygen-independent coproporphyrinogen-3 oxidase
MSAPTAPVDPLTGVEAARFGVYVHFPYCLSKCPYCDFASTVAKVVPQERYAQAISRELSLRRSSLPDRPIDSIYLGGGTPSLWEPRHVEAVLKVLTGALSLSPGAEVTLEANPNAADAARFEDFRRAGINRLSIGVQSFQPRTLKALGREHDGDTAVRAFEAARRAGLDNVSLDFIYGVHGQTLAEVRADAARAVALSPEHLSAYALTLDKASLAEEVPLAKQLARGEVALPPDEAVVEMGHAVQDLYGEAGLARYEISNYAAEGFHARHNTLYWTGGEYLALGAGATGTVSGPEGLLRYSNHRSAERYLEAVERGELPSATREPLEPADRFAERLAMGLRLSAGVDLEAVCREFEVDFAPRRKEAEVLVKRGLATWRGARLSLTREGADLHSAISARLL